MITTTHYLAAASVCPLSRSVEVSPMSGPLEEAGVERIAMSTKEVLRGTILAQVATGQVTLLAAAAQLTVSYRQAKRLFRRYKAAGRVGLRHGNVGRRSNRAWPPADRASVLALIGAHYGGPAHGAGQRFGPTLAAEHLWTEHGYLVPVSTLRGWMRDAGLWSRLRRARPVHVRRPRRAAFGELVQLDGSFHDWFEGRGPRPCLMALVDDATGTMLARFGPEETTWAAAGAIGDADVHVEGGHVAVAHVRDARLHRQRLAQNGNL